MSTDSRAEAPIPQSFETIIHPALNNPEYRDFLTGELDNKIQQNTIRRNRATGADKQSYNQKIREFINQNETATRGIKQSCLDGFNALPVEKMPAYLVDLLNFLSSDCDIDDRTVVLAVLKLQQPLFRDGSTPRFEHEAVLMHAATLLEQEIANILENPDDANFVLDPGEKIHSLIEAIEIISKTSWEIHPAAKNVIWRKFENTFGSLEKHIEDEKRQDLQSKAKQIKNQMNIPERLGKRDHLDFDPEIIELYDIYTNICKRDKSAKWEIYDNSVIFRDQLSSHGLELASFWNLSDVHKVSEALQVLKETDDQDIRARISMETTAAFGIDLDTLTPEQAHVYADEICESVYRVVHSLHAPDSGKDFRAINSFQERLKQPTNKVRKEAVGYLRSFGMAVTDQISDSDLNALLQSDDLIVKVRSKNDAARKSWDTRTSTLKKLFDLDKFVQMRLTHGLAKRTIENLYEGDRTGDCTSFNLKAGVNAWTVPVWLLDPGFNFFFITDDAEIPSSNANSNMLAKMSIFLAKSGSDLKIVVDGFEVTKQAKTDPTASEKIKNGVRNLERWAMRLGLEIEIVGSEELESTVYYGTTSNSTGLVELLSDMTEVVPLGTELDKFAGINGVAAIRRRLARDPYEDVEERVYLQTALGKIDGLKAFSIPDVAAKARDFELVLSELLNSIDDTRIVQKLHHHLQRYDWDGFFKVVMENQFPTLSQKYGSSWEGLQYFAAGTLDSRNEKLENLTPNLAAKSDWTTFIEAVSIDWGIPQDLFSHDVDQKSREWRTHVGNDRTRKTLVQEAFQLNKLFSRLRDIESTHSKSISDNPTQAGMAPSPIDILNFLFGKISGEKIPLSPTLRRLKKSERPK